MRVRRRVRVRDLVSDRVRVSDGVRVRVRVRARVREARLARGVQRGAPLEQQPNGARTLYLRRLQPYVPEAATIRNRGCNHT